MIGRSILEQDHDAAPGIDLDDDDYDGAEDGIDLRLAEPDEDEIPAAFQGGHAADITVSAHPLDVARLQGVLEDLIACRQLLDRALKEG